MDNWKKTPGLDMSAAIASAVVCWLSIATGDFWLGATQALITAGWISCFVLDTVLDY